MKNTGENKSREKPETINTHNKNSEQDISQEVECIKQPGKYRKQWHWKRIKRYFTKPRGISSEKIHSNFHRKTFQSQ